MCKMTGSMVGKYPLYYELSYFNESIGNISTTRAMYDKNVENSPHSVDSLAYSPYYLGHSHRFIQTKCVSTILVFQIDNTILILFY